MGKNNINKVMVGMILSIVILNLMVGGVFGAEAPEDRLYMIDERNLEASINSPNFQKAWVAPQGTGVAGKGGGPDEQLRLWRLAGKIKGSDGGNLQSKILEKITPQDRIQFFNALSDKRLETSSNPVVYALLTSQERETIRNDLLQRMMKLESKKDVKFTGMGNKNIRLNIEELKEDSGYGKKGEKVLVLEKLDSNGQLEGKIVLNPKFVKEVSYDGTSDKYTINIKTKAGEQVFDISAKARMDVDMRLLDADGNPVAYLGYGKSGKVEVKYDNINKEYSISIDNSKSGDAAAVLVGDKDNKKAGAVFLQTYPVEDKNSGGGKASVLIGSAEKDYPLVITKNNGVLKLAISSDYDFDSGKGNVESVVGYGKEWNGVITVNRETELTEESAKTISGNLERIYGLNHGLNTPTSYIGKNGVIISTTDKNQHANVYNYGKEAMQVYSSGQGYVDFYSQGKHLVNNKGDQLNVLRDKTSLSSAAGAATQSQPIRLGSSFNPGVGVALRPGVQLAPNPGLVPSLGTQIPQPQGGCPGGGCPMPGTTISPGAQNNLDGACQPGSDCSGCPSAGSCYGSSSGSSGGGCGPGGCGQSGGSDSYSRTGPVRGFFRNGGFFRRR
ncbi:MAG: hypothetical protein Q8N99_00665 [Nanoarchaeota archaeon]|nr:hypothetical protein [Nanoarchaeota archaeon]